VGTRTPSERVLCLRPRSDFDDLGVAIPEDLDTTFVNDEHDAGEVAPDVACVMLPSAGADLPQDFFARATRLLLIQYTGAGFDRVGKDVLRGLGCAVCNVPGASARDVAAYVAITAGNLLRRFPVAYTLVKSGHYRQARAELAPANVRGFRDLRVGVVGLGSIGAEVAWLFDALGARVAWSDVDRPGNEAAVRFQRLSLNELLRWSELLTVHVPLTPATKALIGSRELGNLPKQAIVVNASRGGIVDEQALVEGLDAGRLGGVALDVFENEPLPADSALLKAARRHDGRLLLSPHVAGVTSEAARELFTRAWANVHGMIIEGREPANQVV